MTQPLDNHLPPTGPENMTQDEERPSRKNSLSKIGIIRRDGEAAGGPGSADYLANRDQEVVVTSYSPDAETQWQSHLTERECTASLDGLSSKGAGDSSMHAHATAMRERVNSVTSGSNRPQRLSLISTKFEGEEVEFAVDRPSSARSGSSSAKTRRSRTTLSSSGKGMREIQESRRRSKLQQQVEAGWPNPAKYNPRSLGFLSLNSSVRRMCIRAIEWKWWDRIVLTLIIMNTFQLALFEPFDTCQLRPSTTRRFFMDLIGKIFSVMFALECLVKVTALGFFFGPKTYLSESFNYLDFFIVILGLLDLAPSTCNIDKESEGGLNLSALRALRALRPLRAASRFPKLRFLITLLISSIPMLANVLGLITFIFFVFGILGVQLFQGIYRGRCYSIDSGALLDDGMCSNTGGMSLCPSSYHCLFLGETLGRNSIGFDGILMAITTIFQVLTYEDWTPIMYATQNTYSGWSWIFFTVLVIVGPMFAVQLFLVVIANSFQQSKKDSEGAVEVLGFETDESRYYRGRRGSVGSVASSIIASEMIKQYQEEKELEKCKSLGESVVASDPLEPHQNQLGGVARRNSTASLAWSEAGSTADGSFTRRSLAHQGLLASGSSKNLNRRSTSQISSNLMKAEHLSRRIRLKLRLFAKSETLTNMVLGFIALNALTMAIQHDCDFCKSSYCANFKGASELANLGFTAVFTLEFVIKLLGLGLRKYLRSMANWMDLLIVAVSLAEIEIVYRTGTCYISEDSCTAIYHKCEALGGTGVSILRTFRLVRVVKLLSAFPEVQKQVRVLQTVMKSVIWLMLLIMIFLFSFLVLGMNVFGGKLTTAWGDLPIALGARVFVQFPWDPTTRYGTVVGTDHFGREATPWQVKIKWGEEVEVMEQLRLGPDGTIWTNGQDLMSHGAPFIVAVAPRFNFDDFGHAFMTSFQTMTAEGWNANLYDAMASTGPISAFYFFALLVIGNWMLFNLFIAILIGEFQGLKAAQLEQSLDVMRHRLREKMSDTDEAIEAGRLLDFFNSLDQDASNEIDMYELQAGLEKMEITIGIRDIMRMIRKYDVDFNGVMSFPEFYHMIKDFMKEDENEFGVGVHPDVPEEAKQLYEAQISARKYSEDQILSCFCFSKAHPIRHTASTVAQNQYFDKVVLLAILISSVCLAVENPRIGENSPERKFLNAIDLTLNLIFLLECIVKVLHLSFVIYIKNPWNKLDFLIVFTSMLDMIITVALSGKDVDLNILKIFRVFRILRALRPLRIITRARSLRILVGTLMSVIKPVSNSLVIALAAFSVMGISGVQLMSGKMHFCSDSRIHQKSECNGIDADGVPRSWENYPVNFDNMLQAMRTMFILATVDDWISHMLAGIDSTSKITGPIVDNNMGYMIFYIFALILAAFIVMNVVIGVFVEAYNTAAENMEYEGKNSQLDTAKNVLKISEVNDEPETGLRALVYETVTRSSFDLMIAVFIVLNVLSMAIETYKPSLWQQELDKITNTFFTLVFGWECLFKMFAFTPRVYFGNPWNKFDYFIVSISFLGLAIDTLSTAFPIEPTILRVLRIVRVFRILRAFRIFKSLNGLRAIITTLIQTLPAMSSLFGILGLLFFIYGILGVSMFGSMCVEGDETKPGLKAVRCMLHDPAYFLEPQANFQNVPWSMLLLLRVATGDAWGSVLEALQQTAGSRRVTEETWELLFQELGLDPTLAGRDSPFFVDAASPEAHLQIASMAIRQWNSSVYGSDQDPFWPLPASAPRAESWIKIARSALPGCLRDSEAIYLQDAGLMDCDVGGYHVTCASTCGELVTANLLFTSFLSMSYFVILQLVIAVLMDQLNACQEGAQQSTIVPGSVILTRGVMARIYRRWGFNAQKRRFAAARRECY